YELLTMCSFFFQAEDGIRDFHVTGVQTCALPILQEALLEEGAFRAAFRRLDSLSELLFELRGTLLRFAQRLLQQGESLFGEFPRSEERRVGKECRCRWLETAD